jgi:hypothetical protein
MKRCGTLFSLSRLQATRIQGPNAVFLKLKRVILKPKRGGFKASSNRVYFTFAQATPMPGALLWNSQEMFTPRTPGMS